MNKPQNLESKKLSESSASLKSKKSTPKIDSRESKNACHKANKTQSKKAGLEAESRACKWLINQGFEILERNFFARFGEIDIIAKKDKTLHFIEVKSSKKTNPIYAITPKKLEKIYKSIDVFFAQNPSECDFCVDGLIMCGAKLDRFLFLPNISL